MPIFDSLSVYKPLLHLAVPITMFILSVMSAMLATLDVTVAAICEGGVQCSQVIYLTTMKSAVAAFGTMFITPWVGGLSDKYGRRPFFILLFLLFAIPNAVLAYSKSRGAVYVYFGVGTITLMLGEGSISALFYAYVSDTIPYESRVSAFGFIGGLFSIGFLGGTVAARLMPEKYIFQFAVGFSAMAILYIVFVMPETLPSLVREKAEEAERKELNSKLGPDEVLLTRKPIYLRNSSTIRETMAVISKNRLLTVVVIIAFLVGVTDSGFQGSLLFFLKAAFNWGKNDFATVTLIGGISFGVSQFVTLPLLSHFFGLRTVILIGLFSGALHVLLYGVAWAPWVVYVAASLSSCSGIVSPALAAVISRSGMQNEQGMLQGVVAGLKSFSSFLSPLLINPITASFVSDNPPFHCPGFGLVVAGSVEAFAFLLAIYLLEVPRANPVIQNVSDYVEIPDDEEITFGLSKKIAASSGS